MSNVSASCSRESVIHFLDSWHQAEVGDSSRLKLLPYRMHVSFRYDPWGSVPHFLYEHEIQSSKCGKSRSPTGEKSRTPMRGNFLLTKKLDTQGPKVLGIQGPRAMTAHLIHYHHPTSPTPISNFTRTSLPTKLILAHLKRTILEIQLHRHRTK